MSKQKTVDATEVVVHLWHAGRAVCGFSRLVPRDWPPGHVWVSLSGASQVSCRGCLRLGEELIAEHYVINGNPAAPQPQGVIDARKLFKNR